jgi:hypothetical protein
MHPTYLQGRTQTIDVLVLDWTGPGEMVPQEYGDLLELSGTRRSVSKLDDDHDWNIPKVHAHHGARSVLGPVLSLRTTQ